MKKRALISVSDKTGVVEFARELVKLGYEIISTGGTASALSASGVANIGISDITGFPECLDGRVKTLHPIVHAGLLALRDNAEHMAKLDEMNINTIDLVAVNLYPFKATIMKDDCTLSEAIENIDIGGPTMLRSAAKNAQSVIVTVDPSDYPSIIEQLKSGNVDMTFKMTLMYKVYQHTASYDSLIAGYLREKLGIKYPDNLTCAYEKVQSLRYGENPHQDAAFYRECIPFCGGVSESKQLNGKELSFNNINDANGALDLLREFDEPSVVAIKHANPCGVASGSTISEAYQKAYDCDPMSIFGGIVACNREVDCETAKNMVKTFLEIVIAPSYTDEALTVLKTKPNLRVLALKGISEQLPNGTVDMKKVVGGLLVQDKDNQVFDSASIKFVTDIKPTATELEEMIFAYKVVKHSKSNAIALTKNHQSVGIGVGQTNRIWATAQAIEHAGERAKGAVLASDAFFPFNDCVAECAKSGIKLIIQPGGSNRDQDSIDLCNQEGIAMVFVSMRHFKH